MKSHCDKQLISDYLAGDAKSFEILVKEYLKPIYSFAYRYVGNSQDAEDIAQDVFIKVWRNIKKFDSSRSFKTWIFSIAKNSCIDNLRKKKSIPFSRFENEKGENILMERIADPRPLIDEILKRADMSKTLNLAMERLTPDFRMVLFLRYNDHFTFKEISESLGEPINTVKSRHRRALIQLKKLL